MSLAATLFGAAIPLACAWALGRWLLRRNALPGVVEFAVGAAAVHLCVFALLAAGIAGRASFAVLAALCLATMLVHRPRWPRLRWTGMRWVWPVAAAYGALYFIHALTPEIQGDALHYHLTLGAAAREGGGFPSRIAFFDLIPQAVETLFAFAYAFGGDSAAKLVHLAFLPALLLLLREIALHMGLAAETGLLAALLFAVTPVAGVTATSAFNDAAMTFYAATVFYLLLAWWQRDDGRLVFPIGICAGFCYAIKFTGGLIAPAALLVLARRRFRAVPLFAAAVLVMALPWMVRAAWLTGNPFAPLLNRFFPNPWFHIESERYLGQYLRNYGEVDPATIPLELTMYGDLLQGLLGPVWLLAPLGLLALRRRSGAVVVSAAVFLALPWLLNIGTRFLMPGLPLAALAIQMAVPRSVGITLLYAHAILSWPAMIPRYAPGDTWALSPEIPWRAALRLEGEQEYQTRITTEVPLAELVEAHTEPGNRIFDLANAPAAITRRHLVSAWQTSLGDVLVRALEAAATPDRGLLVEWRASFPGHEFSVVRLRFPQSRPGSAAIHEIVLLNPAGERIAPMPTWYLRSWPNEWETPYALDGILASSWRSWEPVRAGMFYEVSFPAPLLLAEVRVVAHGSTADLPIELWGRARDWVALAAPSRPEIWPALNLRLSAMRLLDREGIHYILGSTGTDFFGLVSAQMAASPSDWGVEPVAAYKGFTLYRIRLPR